MPFSTGLWSTEELKKNNVECIWCAITIKQTLMKHRNSICAVC